MRPQPPAPPRCGTRRTSCRRSLVHFCNEEVIVKIVRTSGFVTVLLLVGLLRPAAAQSPSLQAELLKDWSDLKTTMDKIANEMPDDKYDFKPTPAQQSFGERTVHVAMVNVGLLASLGGKAVKPMIDGKATIKAAALKAMDDSFDYGIALIKEQNDQTMLEGIAMPPRFLGPSTRARVVYFLIGHTWDIYGQMVVYLRLNGHVPPASQRP
jgi:uncharacterized damage-inducible protein DinB